MKQTFEELIKNYETNPNYQLDLIKNDCYSDTINLLKQVRLFTLQECAEKADTYTDFRTDGYESWEVISVNKDSILNLDPNSIEIDG